MNAIHRAVYILFIYIGFMPWIVAAAPEFIIGFPEDNLSNDWRAAQMKEIERELAKHPEVRFLKADAGGSIAKNILDIHTMVKQGVQLLFLGPRHPESVALVAKELRAKGVKIVLLTRKLNTEDYDVFISPDDFTIARDAATFLVQHLNGTGRILMLEGVPSTSTAIKRKEGFLAGLKTASGISTISKVANYSRAEAIAAIETALREKTKFNAIYAHNDAMASGARYALKQAGIKPGSIPTVGIDFLPEARDAIIKGEQLASFTYPTCGTVGVKVALDLLRGEKVPRYIQVPSRLVTLKNVNNVATAY